MVHRLAGGSYSFVTELYETVNDRSSDAIISWSNNNSDNSFVVWDVEQFCKRILPKSEEFGRNFSEFLSELHHHQFQRIGRFEFGHEDFVRSRPWLLMRMGPSKAWDDKLKVKRDEAKARKARAKVVRLPEDLQISYLIQIVLFAVLYCVLELCGL